MSMTMSVGSLAKISMEPLVPAGTTAAFPTMKPCTAFSVAASGRVAPVGYAVINPSDPGGTTVMLNEYAWATEGIEQLVLDGMGNVRLVPPASGGAPKA